MSLELRARRIVIADAASRRACSHAEGYGSALERRRNSPTRSRRRFRSIESMLRVASNWLSGTRFGLQGRPTDGADWWVLTHRFLGRRVSPVSQPKTKLLQSVRANMRLRHYSPRTESTYVDWIRRFIRYHGTVHPIGLGARHVREFLRHLAV